jgi:hypothetical protein
MIEKRLVILPGYPLQSYNTRFLDQQRSVPHPQRPFRHCERSEAIQSVRKQTLDCRASLAMTNGRLAFYLNKLRTNGEV